MNENLNMQIAALRKMTPAQLREKHFEVFGEPSRSGNKDYLFKRITWRIQSLVEGSLSERARQRAAELARDADIRMTMPPPLRTTPGAERRVGPATTKSDARLPMPGTVLTRNYRGKTIEVTVLPKGFELDGQIYRSLSAVAQAVTGSHWNGNLFFGIKNGDKK